MLDDDDELWLLSVTLFAAHIMPVLCVGLRFLVFGPRPIEH